MAPVSLNIPSELLEFLDGVFPDSLSLATRPGWNLDMAKGAREVIELLKQHRIIQDEDKD